MFQKVLFVGNSITKHGPAPEIGWQGDWGMAASSIEKDYVHVLMSRMKGLKADVQFIVRNTADFERRFWDFDLEQLIEIRQFEADLVIIRIGDNVDEEEAKTRDFGAYFAEFAEYANPLGATVLCTGSFWDKPVTDRGIKKAAGDNGFLFVDINPLSHDEKNMAKDQFWHEGVGAHPSDRGMEKIAGLIWDKLGLR